MKMIMYIVIVFIILLVLLLIYFWPIDTTPMEPMRIIGATQIDYCKVCNLTIQFHETSR